METDAFFENDLKIIDAVYMDKEKNTQSIAELIYGFFFFYTYDFDQTRQQINVKDGGFTEKETKDKCPFSIVDPFESQRNPGRSVLMHSEGHKKIMM